MMDSKLASNSCWFDLASIDSNRGTGLRLLLMHSTVKTRAARMPFFNAAGWPI